MNVSLFVDTQCDNFIYRAIASSDNAKQYYFGTASDLSLGVVHMTLYQVHLSNKREIFFDVESN